MEIPHPGLSNPPTNSTNISLYLADKLMDGKWYLQSRISDLGV